jgi:hypothetical protein
MSRNKRFWILAAGIGSLALPLLWASSSWTELGARTAGLGWLLIGCLIGLGRGYRLQELLLLAAVLAPGLYVTLVSHAGMKALEAYGLCARVLLALGFHAALCALGELAGERRLRILIRTAATAGVPLAFAFGLWRLSVLLAAALCACAAALLLLLRSLKAHD